MIIDLGIRQQIGSTATKVTDLSLNQSRGKTRQLNNYKNNIQYCKIVPRISYCFMAYLRKVKYTLFKTAKCTLSQLKAKNNNIKLMIVCHRNDASLGIVVYALQSKSVVNLIFTYHFCLK